MCNGVRNPEGHTESNPRPSEEGVSIYLVLRPLDGIVAAPACLVPFLLNPAAGLGRHPPWHAKLQCLALVAAFLLGPAFTRGPPPMVRFSLCPVAPACAYSCFARVRPCA